MERLRDRRLDAVIGELLPETPEANVMRGPLIDRALDPQPETPTDSRTSIQTDNEGSQGTSKRRLTFSFKCTFSLLKDSAFLSVTANLFLNF